MEVKSHEGGPKMYQVKSVKHQANGLFPLPVRFFFQIPIPIFVQSELE